MNADDPATILIVEDEPANIGVLFELLQQAGYRVAVAKSGESGLAKAQAVLPDLILLDVAMPGMDGFETCRHLKANSCTQDIPVIFLSVLDGPNDKVRAFTMGGADYMTKPFHTTEILARVKHHLTLHSALVESRQAKLALKQSEERFRALIENASDIITLLDKRGVINYISPSVKRILGYMPEKLVGRTLWDWLHPDDQLQVAEIFAAINDSPGMVFTTELKWKEWDGDWRVLEAIAKQYKDANGFSGVIVTFRDITERLKNEAMQRTLERQNELSELKLRFFAMTSHEFRTPLGVILLAADILETSAPEWLTAKTLRNIHRIQSSAKHLKRMLEDVLTIAKMEAQKLDFNPKPLQLQPLCAHILEEHTVNQESNTPVQMTYIGHDQEMFIDANLLHLILTNLLSNALKYSPQESRVDFAVALKDDAAIFTIKDRGIGISVADQSSLFEMFYRGENVGRVEGSGLGLAIVKKCVDLHGGEISYESKINQGTTFTVCIPRRNSGSAATKDSA